MKIYVMLFLHRCLCQTTTKIRKNKKNKQHQQKRPRTTPKQPKRRETWANFSPLIFVRFFLFEFISGLEVRMQMTEAKSYKWHVLFWYWLIVYIFKHVEKRNFLIKKGIPFLTDRFTQIKRLIGLRKRAANKPIQGVSPLFPQISIAVKPES